MQVDHLGRHTTEWPTLTVAEWAMFFRRWVPDEKLTAPCPRLAYRPPHTPPPDFKHKVKEMRRALKGLPTLPPPSGTLATLSASTGRQIVQVLNHVPLPSAPASAPGAASSEPRTQVR